MFRDTLSGLLLTVSFTSSSFSPSHPHLAFQRKFHNDIPRLKVFEWGQPFYFPRSFSFHLRSFASGPYYIFKLHLLTVRLLPSLATPISSSFYLSHWPLSSSNYIKCQQNHISKYGSCGHCVPSTHAKGGLENLLRKPKNLQTKRANLQGHSCDTYPHCLK